MEELRSTLLHMENTLHQELKSRSYNTVGNFLSFYNDFKRYNPSHFLSFFKSYQPKIVPKSLSCVGLSLALVDKLIAADPYLQPYLFFASCEEWTDASEEEYNGPPDDNDSKEHVMVAMKILLGGRLGIILFDPGYHVPKPIIVMADADYPHTGWILASETVKCRKEYHYSLTKNCNYVHWITRENRNGIETIWHSFIYVGQNFLSPVQVVEKKNLVYSFRTLVVRDERGPKAGFYCNFEGQKQFTLFYKDSGNRLECKIPFAYFELEQQKSIAFEIAVEMCSAQIGYNPASLKSLLKKIVSAYLDQSFMPHLLRVNTILEGESKGS